MCKWRGTVQTIGQILLKLQQSLRTVLTSLRCTASWVKHIFCPDIFVVSYLIFRMATSFALVAEDFKVALHSTPKEENIKGNKHSKNLE